MIYDFQGHYQLKTVTFCSNAPVGPIALLRTKIGGLGIGHRPISRDSPIALKKCTEAIRVPS